jgi:hypothetical protein
MNSCGTGDNKKAEALAVQCHEELMTAVHVRPEETANRVTQQSIGVQSEATVNSQGWDGVQTAIKDFLSRAPNLSANDLASAFDDAAESLLHSSCMSQTASPSQLQSKQRILL